MLDEKKPLVSICVLTYQHEKYIEQALDSFLSQETTFPFEIVIHDDASKDKTAEIIRRYAEQYPDIVKPLLQTENQYSKGVSNISGVFNFPRARGKYIAFCEGDDYWINTKKLQKQVDYMEGHPECAMTFHAAMVVAEDGSFLRETHPYTNDRVLTAEEVIDERELYPSASMLFRTEIAQSLPEFYYQAPVGDIPLHLIMGSKGTVHYEDIMMSAYRLGAVSSWVTTQSQGKREERIKKTLRHNQAMRQMYELFDQYTDGRYHRAVDYTIKRLELGYYLDAEDYKMAMSKKYREIFRKEISLKDRLYVWIRRMIPAGTYQKVRRFLEKKRGQSK